MYTFLRIFLVTILLAFGSTLMASEPYDSYQEDFITKTALVAELANEFGALLETNATSLKIAVTSSRDTVATYADTIPGGRPDEFVLLINGLEGLISVCNDYMIIGNRQASLAAALYALAAIDISQSASTVASTITTQNSALNTAKNSYLTTYALGLGGDGGIANSAQWTIFLRDLARATLAYNSTSPLGLAQCLATFASTNTSLSTLLAAVPESSDDTVVDYDTSYTEAQQAVITGANTLATGITAVSSVLTQLVSSDASTSASKIDYVADASRALQTKINQFSLNNTALIKKATLGVSDIALRVFQRQLLFNVTTYAQKQTLTNSVVNGLSGNSTAATDFQAAVAAVGGLLTVTPPVFTSSPVTSSSSPSVALAAMQAEVDAQVADYTSNLRTTISGLFASPPNQEVVNNALANLMPAIYLQMTSNVMASWLTQRSSNLGGNDSINLADTTVSKYIAEWNALRTIVASTNAAGSSLISSSALAVITTAVTNSTFTDLFSSLPDTGAGAALSTRINTLLKLPSGSVPAIRTQGINEFQRLAVQVILAIQNNSLTAPAITTTNASPTTPSPLAVPSEPTATIDESAMTRAMNDGDEILITGSGTLSTRLRDPIFNSSIANKLTAALKIFMNQSARVGLGTANTSLYPGNTLNVLGGSDASESTSVQIIPDGNCFLDVNSDLLFGGSKPLIPTPNFGTDVHQITFYSPVPRTITITSNTTWDLSDFGSTGDDYIDYGKQIVFAGKIRLVLEPGAKIRFPYVDPSKKAQAPILYFDDESSLVFLGDPLVVGMPWTDSNIAGTDCKRSKILGTGQIWLNKTATMTVHKPALVGIEADFTTPKTDITLSLQRNAQALIGTESIAGGAFQIGNMYNGGSSANPENAASDVNFPNSSINADGEFIPNDTSIDFTLVLNGNQPVFQIGRQGFFGIAAGIINKDGAPASTSQAPNGVSGIPHSAWQLQRLYNVGNVTLNITQGIFDHKIIADGSSGDCSMLALSKPAGQFPFSKYIIEVGQNGRGVIRGGGNVYFVDKEASMVLHSDKTVTASPHTVSLGNTAEALSFTLSNSGTYAPLAPSLTIKGRFYNIPGVTTYSLYGRGIVQSSNTIPYIFAGPAEEFYTVLTLNNYSDSTERYVPMSIINSTPKIAYINGGTIVRQLLTTAQLKDGTIDQASGLGYLRGAKQISGEPTAFYLPTE